MVKTHVTIGAILFDATLGIEPTEAWFDPRYWSEQGKATKADGGRGGVAWVETPAGACVLRHYRRGGLMAHLTADRYIWMGASRTRSFREFSMLAQLLDAQLPVPAPVAAFYRREACYYRADLITKAIPNSQTLAVCLKKNTLDFNMAQQVGQTLARFHAFGAYHADLNAHNILLDAEGKVWLLDFDRGRIRRPAYRWQLDNLARLRRSLSKLGAFADKPHFDAHFWHPLCAAYHTALAKADTTHVKE